MIDRYIRKHYRKISNAIQNYAYLITWLKGYYWFRTEMFIANNKVVLYAARA